MKIFKQEQKVEFSGYVRGYKLYDIYYDESGNVIDYTNKGDLEIIRDDTDRDTFPNFDPTKPFTEEFEEEY